MGRLGRRQMEHTKRPTSSKWHSIPLSIYDEAKICEIDEGEEAHELGVQLLVKSSHQHNSEDVSKAQITGNKYQRIRSR